MPTRCRLDFMGGTDVVLVPVGFCGSEDAGWILRRPGCRLDFCGGDQDAGWIFATA
jgi:hypothetical protein